mgnify:CR=1 FL=1
MCVLLKKIQLEHLQNRYICINKNKNMIQIANPIYDVVFKYLMNDNKVAKLLLSAIIDEEIIELEFQPTELSLPLHESLTVLRMDFKATIQQSNGEHKIIIIEIQTSDKIFIQFILITIKFIFFRLIFLI